MIKLNRDQDFLNDVEFIRKNYSEYFDSLCIRDRNPERVVFEVIPLNETKRIVTVELTSRAFQILSDTGLESRVVGTSYESFEQLLSGIMGETEFSNMLMKLTLTKLS